MDYNLPGFSAHGNSQARVLKWVAISFSRGSSWPRDPNPGLLHFRQILDWLSYQRNPIPGILSYTPWLTPGLALGSQASISHAPHTEAAKESPQCPSPLSVLLLLWRIRKLCRNHRQAGGRRSLGTFQWYLEENASALKEISQRKSSVKPTLFRKIHFLALPASVWKC